MNNPNENPAHIQCPYCLNGYNDEQTGATITQGEGKDDCHCCSECVGDAIQPLIDNQISFYLEYVNEGKLAKETIEFIKQKDEK